MIINESDAGAYFSSDRRFRYALWRIWDRSLPFVMFVGLNPSTADEVDADPTIRSVFRIARFNGFGGIYMMNCFPYVSTDPDELLPCSDWIENERWLKRVADRCQGNVVFAWGNFPIVKKLGVDYIMTGWFPGAKALHINKNGSPKHPLYCKTETKLIDWK